MEAVRRIEKLAGNQLTLVLPDSFREKRVEVIVLPLDEQPETTQRARRKPAPELANTEILGDIMAPAVPEDDWDALR